MKSPDLKSTLVAGVLGGVLVAIFANVLNVCGSTDASGNPTTCSLAATSTLLAGFLAGAGLQIAIRALGVS